MQKSLAARSFLVTFALCTLVARTTCAADPQTSPAGNTAIKPVPREAGWLKRHEGFVAQAKEGGIDVLFVGDSITDGWRNQKLWQERYVPLKAADFGISADRTEHVLWRYVLWRLQNGELDGIKPRVIVLMIGTNNTRSNSAPEIVEGIMAIVKEFRTRLPQSKILLLGIFPRDAQPNTPNRVKIKEINSSIARLDDGKLVKYLDIGDKFLEPDGTMSKEVMPDYLHPNANGYQIWADAMQDSLMSLLK
ncbi:MAG: GDSL family lipase [Verrucomicrobia bacterium]|nr:GDSL family lipase [Verrucomicrobiota bacterium]